MLISRSTKLVIIERLLLLAERYVITIEVFDCTICRIQVVTDTIYVIIVVCFNQNLVFFENKAVVFVYKLMYLCFCAGHVLISSHYSTSWGLV